MLITECRKQTDVQISKSHPECKCPKWKVVTKVVWECLLQRVRDSIIQEQIRK